MGTDFGGLRCSPEFASNSRARPTARCLFNLLGTRASCAAVLISSSRAAVVVPLDFLLLSYQRISSSHFSSAAGRSCSLHRSGTRIGRTSALRFTYSEDPNDRPNVAALPDLMVLLQERCRSFRVLSKLRLHNMDLFALFQNIVNWFFTQRTEQVFECVVRDNMVLFFYTTQSRARKLSRTAPIRNPVVFLSLSVNLADSLVNVGGCPKP